MRRLHDLVTARLLDDKAVAEAGTVCRRRGTMARAVLVEDDGIVLTPHRAINGGEWCTAAPGGCGCPHAEQRLILSMLGSGAVGHLLLSTLEPCEQCANLIVLSKMFSGVAWLEPYRDQRGREVLKRAGVACGDSSSPFAFTMTQ